ncbi:carbohydrate ABC transporter permease [Paenibacillus sp. GP183]|jgi:raffinose/stachyose/melibiose transport system permease protein|uniref:carbohydrate ABC transporter permease n=1 Tax=Paenibacillus sp. GP183 TaxID=1882751 RepID=UPI00089D31B0|nr:carbohydrate ABC transporter permease [Paenibacillus sp. GP183]SEC28832.1 raffinose/stachyose/melibiose transport system permease protein [Paenibacillus sp. GP183]
MSEGMSRRLYSVLSWIVLGVLAVYFLFPIYMALINSFKSQAEIYKFVLKLPSSLNFKNYVDAFTKGNLLKAGLNTVIVTVTGIVGIIACSSLAGYKLSRTRGRLSGAIFTLFVASMLIPFQTIMVTLTKMARDLKLQGSPLGLGIVCAGLGVNMAIFLYHGFVKGIPRELDESASIDGCGEWRAYFTIIFPLLLPITFTIIVLNLLWLWNDFLLPLLLLNDYHAYTLVLAINMFFGKYTSDWPLILASLVISSVPIIVIFAVFQRWIIQGITEGAVKG